jgi:hypothetical protein
MLKADGPFFSGFVVGAATAAGFCEGAKGAAVRVAGRGEIGMLGRFDFGA